MRLIIDVGNHLDLKILSIIFKLFQSLKKQKIKIVSIFKKTEKISTFYLINCLIRLVLTLLISIVIIERLFFSMEIIKTGHSEIE